MVWQRWCAMGIALAFGGCGRVAFDPLGDALGACGPWTAATRFTTPLRVAEVNPTNDQQQPHLSGDGLTIYFAAFTSDYHIYTAERTARDQPFANARELTEVRAGSAADTAFAPTIDQLTAYMSSNRGGDIDIWISQRGTTTEPWGTPVRSAVSTSFIDYDPIQSADGLRLYWAIVMWDQGVGATDLVVATRASVTDSFGPPSLVAGVDTLEVDDNPSETADGRMLVFSSQRAGGGDIYFSTRASIADAYGAPSPVPDVNMGATAESEPFVTADGCELWFTSDRGGAHDIYSASVIR
jgi:hypothetical protein